MGYNIKIVHEWKYIENKLPVSKSKVTKIKHLELIFICMCQI